MKFLYKAIGSIVLIGFFGFIYLFVGNVMFDAGDAYILNYTTNATLAAADELNLSNATKTLITDQYISYQNTQFPADELFLSVILILYISHLTAAFKARKLGVYSFFGLFTIGLGLIMLFLTIFEQVRVWLFEQFITNLFGLQALSTPWIDAFFGNFLFIGFIWIVTILIANQLDVEILNRNVGRREE